VRSEEQVVDALIEHVRALAVDNIATMVLTEDGFTKLLYLAKVRAVKRWIAIVFLCAFVGGTLVGALKHVPAHILTPFFTVLGGFIIALVPDSERQKRAVELAGLIHKADQATIDQVLLQLDELVFADIGTKYVTAITLNKALLVLQSRRNAYTLSFLSEFGSDEMSGIETLKKSLRNQIEKPRVWQNE
jgi:hypothetical protein